MSLLDDVSIVVTPNGYKAGELYAVVPVPTEGAEEVTNGDFSGSSTGWSESGTWTYGNNNEVCTGNGTNQMLTQSGILTSGKLYTYSIDIISSSLSSQEIRVYVGSTDYITHTLSGVAETISGNTVSSGANLVIRVTSSNTSGVLTIDNVSIKEYTSADMDVTRATAATRVDENGLVNYAEVLGGEEVTNGDFSSSSDWNLGTNSIVSSNKATLTITSGGLQYATNIGLDVVNTKTYKITFTANRTSGTGDLEFGYGSGLSVSGSPTISASGTQTIYFQPTYNTNDFGFKSKTTSGDYVWEISNLSVKEVTRDNVPRIDYTGGGCPHILAEPQRTNLLPYSEDFTSWTTTGSAAVTPNTTISPDGTQNADTLNLLAGSYFYKVLTTGAGTFTLSCYVKVASGTLDFKMQSFGADGAISSGVFTATTNWQRFEFTTTITANSGFYPVQVSGLVGGDFQIWGAQVEEGSYATSYIPTSGSTVTRNQDIFTRDGIGSLINSTEGVLFVEMAALADDETNREITLSDGSTTNYVLIRFNSGGSNRIYTRVDVGGGNEYYDLDTSHTITDVNKIAIRWDDSNFATFINGIKVGSQLSGSSFSADTLNELNFDNGAGSNTFYGKVKQLQVYNTALTDEQLTSLTT